MRERNRTLFRFVSAGGDHGGDPGSRSTRERAGHHQGQRHRQRQVRHAASGLGGRAADRRPLTGGTNGYAAEPLHPPGPVPDGRPGREERQLLHGHRERQPREGPPKALGTGFQLLDAYGSWDIAPEFAIQGGLILIPLCRDCNSSAAALLGLDYGLWSFQESAPTQSSIGRDTGFQLKGLLLDKHLEYRIGAYSGFRQTNAKNSFRYAGRLQYNVFDVEVAQFYTTQYFATKKILAIGAGFDTQSTYNSFAGDIMLNLPVGKKNAFTFQGDFIRYDGSTFFTAAGIRKQNVFFAEAGFYICELKLEPFAVYQQQDYLNSPDKVLNKTRLSRPA